MPLFSASGSKPQFLSAEDQAAYALPDPDLTGGGLLSGTRSLVQSLAGTLLAKTAPSFPTEDEPNGGLEAYSTPAAVGSRSDHMSDQGYQKSPSPLDLHESPGTKKRKGIMVRVYEYDGTSLCAGKIGLGDKWCGALKGDCKFDKHLRKKADVKPGFYLGLNETSLFLTPYLPLTAMESCSRFAELRHEEYPLSKWITLFRAYDDEHEGQTSGVGETFGAEDTVQTVTAHAGPTPFKRIKLDPTFLNPKTEGETEGEDLSFVSVDRHDRLGDVAKAIDALIARLTGVEAGIGSPPDQYASVWSALEPALAVVERYSDLLATLGGPGDNSHSAQTKLLGLVTADVKKFQRHVTNLESGIAASKATAASAEHMARTAQSDMAAYRATGSAGYHGNINQRLERLQDWGADQELFTQGLQDDLVKVVSALESMGKDLQARTNQATQARGGNSSASDPAVASLRSDVSALRQEIRGGHIETPAGDFRSLEDVTIWAQVNLPQALVYGNFWDLNVALTAADRELVRSASELQALELHGARVHRTDLQSDVVHAFQLSEPSILAGPKGPTERAVHFGAMKTFAAWNTGDGVAGLYNRIKDGLDVHGPAVRANIEMELELFPEAKLLCKHLLEKTLLFWRALCSRIESLYKELLVKGFGPGPTYSASAQAQCWTIVTTLLRVFFQEMRRVRVVASNAHQFKGRENVLYLWGVLQGHGVMDTFLKHEFTRHPKFHPQLLDHLFKSTAPRAVVDELRAENSKLKLRIASLDSSLGELESRMSRFENKSNQRSNKTSPRKKKKGQATDDVDMEEIE